MNSPLIRITPEGLYCEAGGFHIDPWKRVERAIITHAHSDHARRGSQHYLCADRGESILRQRIGQNAKIQGIPYGEPLTLKEVKVSLHPAGHILGSAQIRVEHQGQAWVVSGDYKTAPDVSCDAFEPVKCHTFITESTFGMPHYRWRPAAEVFAEIHDWWRRNREQGRTSVLFAYSLGKAQRVLAGLDTSIGPIGVHDTVAPFVSMYREQGIRMPEVLKITEKTLPELKGEGLLVAPSSVQNTPLLRKLGPCSLAFASGWMSVRGNRRWQALDRGFALSDHADWPGLLEAIRETGAEQIGVTHGYTDNFVRYLKEVEGREAFVVPTRFTGEGTDLKKTEDGE